MKRLYTVHFLSIFLSCGLAAQESYTLKQCIEMGLERNYSLRIVENEEIISGNNVSLGNAGYLPVIEASGDLGGTLYDYDYDYTDGTSSRDNNVNSETANVGVALNWTVFDGFNIQTNYKRLKELQSLGELNTRIAIEDLAADIAAEYYSLIRQQKRYRNLRSAVTLSKERLRIVEERYIIGSMSKLDLQQARVDFNADSSQLLTQLQSVHASEVRLNELMGIDSVDKKFGTVDTIPLLTLVQKEQELWDNVLENNTSLIASNKNRTISELDYKKIASRNYPYLKLNAGYGYNANWYGAGTTDLQKRLGFNYGLTVGYTIFDGMNRKREQRNARIQIKNYELQIQNLELSIRANLSNLWMAYQNNQELINLEKQNLLVAKEYYDIAIERYKLGDLSGIELREAQINLLNAEERQSISEYNTKLCEISLMQISGQISNYLR
jgi:outer membrane protein TolC